MLIIYMNINISDDKQTELMAHIELLNRKLDLILEKLNLNDEDMSSDSDDCDDVVEKIKEVKLQD
jgi:hypothetical protein